MKRNAKAIRVPGAEIQLEDRPGYLYAFVSGPKDSVDVSIRCAEQIGKEAKKRGTRKILIEEDFPNDLSTTETFDVCSKAPSIYQLGTTIAHVDRNAEQHETNVFGGAVAYNRGLVNRTFATVEEAEKWLTS